MSSGVSQQFKLGELHSTRTKNRMFASYELMGDEKNFMNFSKRLLLRHTDSCELVARDKIQINYACANMTER
jgi:hypothetical protein